MISHYKVEIGGLQMSYLISTTLCIYTNPNTSDNKKRKSIGCL